MPKLPRRQDRDQAVKPIRSFCTGVAVSMKHVALAHLVDELPRLRFLSLCASSHDEQVVLSRARIVSR